MINYNVPFFENTADNTHCMQASFKMILKYFLPQEEYSFEELDRITAKVEGLWTWPLAGMIWFKKKGFDVKNIEIFNYQEFIKKREQYLLDFYGEEVGQSQIQHSYVPQEIEYAKKFIQDINIEIKIPNADEIKGLLDDGYLLVCNVNSCILKNNPGYAGHAIVVKGYTGNSFIIHNPGLPASQNYTVDNSLFEKAWAYPDERAKNIMAFKLKN